MFRFAIISSVPVSCVAGRRAKLQDASVVYSATSKYLQESVERISKEKVINEKYEQLKRCQIFELQDTQNAVEAAAKNIYSSERVGFDGVQQAFKNVYEIIAKRSNPNSCARWALSRVQLKLKKFQAKLKKQKPEGHGGDSDSDSSDSAPSEDSLSEDSNSHDSAAAEDTGSDSEAIAVSLSKYLFWLSEKWFQIFMQWKFDIYWWLAIFIFVSSFGKHF